jgi:hypothetical protein
MRLILAPSDYDRWLSVDRPDAIELLLAIQSLTMLAFLSNRLTST